MASFLRFLVFFRCLFPPARFKVPHQHLHSDEDEGPPRSYRRKRTDFCRHPAQYSRGYGRRCGLRWNISRYARTPFIRVFALAMGIAQNFPKVPKHSMPLRAEGASKKQAFLWGTCPERLSLWLPLVTILLARLVTPILPLFSKLCRWRRGSTVVEELIPEMSAGGPFRILDRLLMR